MFLMPDRINVSPRELAAAMKVWLRVMPTRIWRQLEAFHLAAEKKRQGERPDVEGAVAEYLAGKFDQAGWDVSHDERGIPFSNPARRQDSK